MNFPLSIHSIITVIHLSRAIKLYKLRKFWSVDYSFRYFLSDSISYMNQVVMQIGELTIRGYFGACSHVTETQGFFQQKKNERGKWKCLKKWHYMLINLWHPVKCIHRLCCLHFEESCSLLIAERRLWIKRSNKYLPQQFFKRQIIFKAREYLIKKYHRRPGIYKL